MTNITKDELPQRDLKQSIKRGLQGKCPKCGEGKIFDGYLKVNDHCPVCDEDLSHQRADDGPAWATMLIVGHFVPPIIMAIFENFPNPNMYVVTIGLCAFFIAMTLVLLPRIKGVFVNVQWRNYMYGFDPRKNPAYEDEHNGLKI